MMNREVNRFQLIDFGGAVQLPLLPGTVLGFRGAADALAPELRDWHDSGRQGPRPISCAVDVYSLACIIGPMLMRCLSYAVDEVEQWFSADVSEFEIRKLFWDLNEPISKLALQYFEKLTELVSHVSGRYVTEQFVCCLLVLRVFVDRLLHSYNSPSYAVGLDLVRKMVEQDPKKRIRASEAIHHRYFADSSGTSFGNFPFLSIYLSISLFSFLPYSYIVRFT